jgi:chloramphenicol-sensitive protein RarD
VYTYAVTKGKALEASLGYYINPLFSVVLGVVFLRERLRRLQIVAFFTAMAGVVYLTVVQGSLPWVSVVLPFFFGLYGLVKKTTAVEPLLSLGFETIISGPLAMGWILVTLFRGQGSMVYDGPWTTVLLIGSGAMTVAPLVFFAGATHRIALASVGFLQYIAPTLILIFGVTVLGEPFPLHRLPGFLLVWIGLAVYSAGTFVGTKRQSFR